MKLRLAGSVLLCASVIFSLRLAADQAKASKKSPTMAEHIITPDMIKFAPGPPVLPAGFELAGLGGGMVEEGSPYTVPPRFPDGDKGPAHFHPRGGPVTRVSGAFWVGKGHNVCEASLKDK